MISEGQYAAEGRLNGRATSLPLFRYVEACSLAEPRHFGGIADIFDTPETPMRLAAIDRIAVVDQCVGLGAASQRNTERRGFRGWHQSALGARDFFTGMFWAGIT